MTPAPRPLLEIDRLQSPHGGPYELTVGCNECISIVGRSGSGKSVLLRLIADLDPHDGDVRLDGRSRSTWPAPQWRRQVVYQAAEPAWWAPTARAHFAPADLPAALAVLQSLDLAEPLLDTDIARLSTGERQRMALARSLACAPRVLLLDEPTAALDAASTAAVEALLAERRRLGLSIVFVTHAHEQAERMAGRRYEVRDRRLHAAA